MDIFKQNDKLMKLPDNIIEKRKTIKTGTCEVSI